MIQKLVWENVKHRPLRTFLSALLIAIPVTLVLTLVGLSQGILHDKQRSANGIGADILIRPKNSTFLALGSAPIDERLLDYLRKQPHVSIATGVAWQSLTGISSAAGIDLPEFNKMSGGLVYLQGGPFRNKNEIIVDDYFAKEKKAKAGDTVKLLNRDWKISGVVESGKLNRVFMDLRTVQELTSNTGHLNQIYLKLDDPKNTESVIEELKEKLEDYPIYSVQEFTALFAVNKIPQLATFIDVMVGVAVFIGFAVVCLSMYMAVLQRTREIGILKALGASRVFIVSTILREAVFLAIGGTIIGIGLSYAATKMLYVLMPASIPAVAVPLWWPIAGAIALVGSVLGALYPGMRAAGMDPIEALAYE